tara:strand:+ start:455 stop:871 length:417 start_codon:yes stop_codon:yes gene_type:complete
MKKLCVVLADYYKDVSKMLLDGATSEVLKNKNNAVIKKIYHVPGAFEIPVTISKNINKYDGFVALGCVIKGETPHFDLISKAAINAIMDLSVENKKPIGNGIITCLNKKQALERANPEGKNIGGNAVSAVLQTLANFK